MTTQAEHRWYIVRRTLDGRAFIEKYYFTDEASARDYCWDHNEGASGSFYYWTDFRN